ncbi:hypothetical protein D3C80_1526670 [compost metagenome]
MAISVALRGAPRAGVSHTPGPVVQASLQIQVVAVVIVIPLVSAKAVVQQNRRNALVPLFRRNIAACAVVHRHLRQTDVEAQRGKIEANFAARNGRRQGNTGVVCHLGQFRKCADIHTQAVKHCAGDTG